MGKRVIKKKRIPWNKFISPKVAAKLPNTVRELSEEEIAEAKDLYFSGMSDSQVVKTMRMNGWEDFCSSELVGNHQAGMKGLAPGLGWGAERSAIERRLREEETITAADAAAEPQALDGAATEKQSFSANRAAEPRGDKSFTVPFPEWLKCQESNWDWDWKYQKTIYKALEKFDFKKPQRLMIFLPPRHGKSELVTVRYVAWLLLRRPELRVVIGSYNQKLANRFSRRIRRIYLEQLGAAVDIPKGGLLKTADDWETSAGGGVKAVGVGAGITGFGADLIIIDDPIKSRAEANSD
ncbi:MAG: terminase family protein, partial [Acidobacteriota bacterium]